MKRRAELREFLAEREYQRRTEHLEPLRDQHRKPLEGQNAKTTQQNKQANMKTLGFFLLLVLVVSLLTCILPLSPIIVLEIRRQLAIGCPTPSCSRHFIDTWFFNSSFYLFVFGRRVQSSGHHVCLFCVWLLCLGVCIPQRGHGLS